MDSLIAKFGKIIKEIVGCEPIYGSPKNQRKVLYPNDDYFCTSVSSGEPRDCVEFYLCHVQGSERMLVIDSKGVNFMLEKADRGSPGFHLIAMSAIVDYYEVCYLEFDCGSKFWGHGLLRRISLSKDHPTVELRGSYSYFDEYTQSLPTTEVRRSRLTVHYSEGEDHCIRNIGKLKLHLVVPLLVNHLFTFEAHFGMEGQASISLRIAIAYDHALSKKKVWYNNHPISFPLRAIETLFGATPYNERQFDKARANLLKKWEDLIYTM